MKNLATVPTEISDEIINFCYNINLNSSPLYIDSSPINGNLIGNCFENVSQSIQIDQSSALGWIIWQTTNHLLQAEFHSVIKNKNGSFKCVTPYNRKYEKILFLPDETMIYDQKRVSSIYRSLSGLKEVELFIHALEALSEIEVYMSNPLIVEQFKSAEFQKNRESLQSTMHQIETAIEAYEKIVLNGVRRNDPCICNSGKKFKHCCGN